MEFIFSIIKLNKMNIQKMIPSFAIAIGLALAMATSGFREGPKGNLDLTFYEYTGSDFSQTNIQDINKYVRSTNSCSGSRNVCGILLATDNGVGNPPNSTEFSAESSNLWTSQQNHAAADPNVVMKS
jgi:hypothetical protein